jgi:hypothetical protein
MLVLRRKPQQPKLLTRNCNYTSLVLYVIALSVAFTRLYLLTRDHVVISNLL